MPHLRALAVLGDVGDARAVGLVEDVQVLEEEVAMTGVVPHEGHVLLPRAEALALALLAAAVNLAAVAQSC